MAETENELTPKLKIHTTSLDVNIKQRKYVNLKYHGGGRNTFML